MNDPGLGEAEYLCYSVVRELENRGHEVSRSKFYKTTVLAHKQLQEEGVDVGLPHYWYKYGEVVDTGELDGNFMRTKTRNWGARRGTQVLLNEDISGEDFITDGGVKPAVDEKAGEIADQYEDQYAVGPIKDETYEIFDTTEFVVQFNVFRNRLDDIADAHESSDKDVAGVGVSMDDLTARSQAETSDQTALSEEDREELRDFLTALVEKYPREAYSYAERQFRKWESLSRHLLKNDMLVVFRKFAEEFWEMFSKVELRLRHNENIPRNKKFIWRRKRGGFVQDFEEDIEKRRDQVLGRREPTNRRNQIADSYSKAVRSKYWNHKSGQYLE